MNLATLLAIISNLHFAGFVFLAFIAGAIGGYVFRNAIAKDISGLQVNSWISKLEATAGQDLLGMKTIASQVASELRKL